jgi:heparanase 1
LQTKLAETSTLDFIHRISQPLQRAQEAEAPNVDLWVGETAAAWDSGQAGVCDSFLSGFWYINQLGMLASTGHKAMCRQAFVGGNYGLLDQSQDFKPNPDYYTGLLFHRLMGSAYLDCPQLEPAEADLIAELRSYAACTAGTVNGSVTVAYSNQFENDTVNLTLVVDRLSVGPDDAGSVAQVYVLTADTLLARDIRLNGELLAMVDETTLPSLEPATVSMSETLLLPPLSYGFLVFPDAQATACMQE